jgi:hypothetical protein
MTPLITALAIMSTSAGELSLTIYNDDFAVVRETLNLDLKEGVNDVVYDRATLQLEPDSVILRDTASGQVIPVLEQTYRNDPVSEGLLLSLFEGQTIEFLKQEPQKPDRRIMGKIIRSGYQLGAGASFDPRQAIIESEGKIQFGLPGQPLFPNLGDGTILRPALGWKIGAKRAGALNAEVGYITRGLSWKASYNVILPEKGDSSAMVGWITMQNSTGRLFESANVKLLAGDVRKIQEFAGAALPMARATAILIDEPQVQQKAFDDFHLYTLPRKLDLRDRETKQVEFIRAADVKIKTLYIYDALSKSPVWYGAQPYINAEISADDADEVMIVREFENTKDNNLGVPLPEGRIRFYRRDDQDGSLQFVGEDTIDHTPRGETVRLQSGTAFDLVVKRERMDFKLDSSNKMMTEKYKLVLKNRKSEAVTIRVVEHAVRWSQWQILESSQPHEKINAHEFRFNVDLRPDEEKELTYTIRYNW